MLPVLCSSEMCGYKNEKILLSTATIQNVRFLSTVQSEENYHSIIKDNEKPTGQSDKHEFQAETRMLLDIVARSLYSEKEVSRIEPGYAKRRKKF